MPDSNTDRYDVVIAGAGPAGAHCARDVATRGYDVVVFEAESEAEFPRQSNKSTGGTFPAMLSSFGIPDDVVMNYTDNVVFESPTEHYTHYQPGAVLDFPEFKRFLVRDGQSSGAEYRFDARVSKPVFEGGEIVGVEYGGGQTVYGDIVIDATGPAAVLSRQLGVSGLEREAQAIGIEYEMEGLTLAPDGYADLADAMMLRLDHDVAPGGYSWIFHTGGDTAKVGLCYIQNDAHRAYATEGMRIDGYLQRWLETDPRFENAERIAERHHRGSAHIQLPDALSTDNFMAIGDTVPTVDPVWGEGIYACMKSGRAAATTVDHCFIASDVDTSAENLAAYDDRWHTEVAPQMRTRLLISRVLYNASNDRYDTFIRDMERLSDDELRAVNAGNPRALAKLLHVDDIPLLVRVLTESKSWNPTKLTSRALNPS
ncbi:MULTISPECIES: digeranylgeranylglycerophospholipid reductase [Haloferax]|uniref:Geranylgeranyl reductase family protein n=2 Tax=Haloferax TaxID=2251 RepID=A0A6G1YZ26_9EURY|nr:MULTISPECIES: digeranylgeranylglycerophospholipid reductase [Haloferax]KAB1186903.1 NAD(P)/FAD-dependent oxidoreductase [Haloferax sp. CBA1149]MRW79532.1 geranylgeranyl reductase family protein [Haloferax marinisediminis]